MSNQTEVAPTNAHNSCATPEEIEPCACCRALATKYTQSSQLRTPAVITPKAAAPPEHRAKEGSAFPFLRPIGKADRSESITTPSKAQSGPEPKDSAPPERSSNAQSKEANPESLEQDTWQDDALAARTNNRKLWQGWDGLAVMICGVILPALLIFASAASAPKRLTLLVLNHPLETLLELLLIASIPLINYQAWRALCRNNTRFSLVNGIALGSALSTATLIAGVCLAGLIAGSQQLQSEIGTSFTTGFSWLMILSLAAASIGILLMNRFRATRDFAGSKNQIAIYTACGAVLAVLGFAIAETRPWYIRTAEALACSNNAREHQEGLARLRLVNPQRELLMECSDARAAGLPGLFIPLKPSDQHELYFQVTGKPFAFSDGNNSDLSSMPDDYVSRHTVGDKIKGLSLIRSSITSELHPNTLSATTNWTFVFKNDTASAQEARAEIGLPPGAVISGLTRWINGEPRNSVFAASGRGGEQGSLEIGHDSAAIATDLGRGRVLVHCFPVTADEQLKMRVTIVEPLKPDTASAATMVLPKLLATNFDIPGEHALQLSSNLPLSSGLKALKATVSGSEQHVLSGTLFDKQLEDADIIITASRAPTPAEVAVLDPIATRLAQKEANHRALLAAKEARRIEEENRKTEQVVLMVDGSRAVGNQLDNVARALQGRNSKRSSTVKAEAVPNHYLLQAVSRTATPAPKHLVVVIDGSVALNGRLDEIAAGLSKIPDSVPTSIMIASQDKPDLMHPLARDNGLQTLRKTTFIGGQDNLEAVVAAAEEAGKAEGGAVLWIHGPQPVLNSNIYIMAPYKAVPSFYELPLESSETDMYEFFKNHAEIGPFAQVPRNSSVPKDLEQFFSKWQSDSNDYATSFVTSTSSPQHLNLVSNQEAHELLLLHANEQVNKLLSMRRSGKAAEIAVAYGIVTPVSTTLVLPERTNAQASAADSAANDNEAAGSGSGAQEELQAQQTDARANGSVGATNADETSSAPALQEATNGTIGPQGADAAYIKSVSTAGTVRVNNLANLEALLNIIANFFEIALCLFGVVIATHGFLIKGMVTQLLGIPVELSPGRRIVLGIGLVLLGLFTPGVINWFVASARDANLFS